MRNFRHLDLNHLILFEAIFAAGNISHAAKALNVSQPKLSNTLARLRETLDDQLFVRNGRGVLPTPKALQMIGPVREALQMIESGVADQSGFDPATSKRHFRIVILDQVEPVLIPPLLRAIEKHRTITLENLHIASTPLIAGLNDGSLDLVVAPYLKDLEDSRCHAVAPVDVMMITRRNHPEIGDALTREDFARLGHVALTPKLRALSRFDEELRQMKIERHIVYYVNKMWSFPAMVAETCLIAAVPGDFARLAARHYPIDIHPMPFDIAEQQVYMTWKTGRENDPGHIWLREQIIEAYGQTFPADRETGLKPKSEQR